MPRRAVGRGIFFYDSKSQPPPLRIEKNFPLRGYNTFHLPARARWFMEYDNEDELGRILRDEYFQELRSLHIGAGSNLLFVTDFNGIIVHSRIRGITPVRETETDVTLRIGAAEVWDDVVHYAVSRGWGGIENLSLIPGEAGAAAVQNIGAYGAELKDVVESVEAFNQLTFERHTFSATDCEYAYRYSAFKDPHRDPHIVTHINLRLRKHPTLQLDYAPLREALGNAPLHPTLRDVREAVIAIRRSKLPDPDQLGNAGSFFMNPLIDRPHFDRLRALHPDIPSYPAPDGRIKIPAGWLIERCGFKGLREGEVGVYERQALIIVNHGHATGDDIARFAERIRNTVEERFGINLTPEVRYVE